MDNPQEKFNATVKLLLSKFPSERANQYDDEEWVLYERYVPQVLALTRNYNDSQGGSQPIKPTMDFVLLLVNAAKYFLPSLDVRRYHFGPLTCLCDCSAIHDNDTTNVVHIFLDTADTAFTRVPTGEQDQLLWAFLQSLKCMYHLCTSDFHTSEDEMREGLMIRLKLLQPDDLLLALGYSWLGMAVGAQGRYGEGLELLLKAGKVLEGPAGEIPTRKLIWGYNTSRNYYCMEKYAEAEMLLTAALEDAERLQSWYMQV